MSRAMPVSATICGLDGCPAGTSPMAPAGTGRLCADTAGRLCMAVRRAQEIPDTATGLPRPVSVGCG
jgi:hypothetical protein